MLALAGFGLSGFGLSGTASAQDPLADFKQEVQTTRPATIDLSLPPEKLQQELKKFYEDREKKIAKIIDTRLRSFSDLRQALQLKDWGDVTKLGARGKSGGRRQRHPTACVGRQEVPGHGAADRGQGGR